MKKVVFYQTSDGEEFSSLKTAREYAQLAFEHKLKSVSEELYLALTEDLQFSQSGSKELADYIRENIYKFRELANFAEDCTADPSLAD